MDSKNSEESPSRISRMADSCKNAIGRARGGIIGIVDRLRSSSRPSSSSSKAKRKFDDPGDGESASPAGFSSTSKSSKKNRFPKAFPGDTYVADLHRASKAGKPWTGILFAVVLVSAFADFFLLEDAFAWMLDASNISDVLNPPEGSIVSAAIDAAPAMFICIALVLLYLTFCHMAGKKFAEYKVFRVRSSLAIVAVLIAIIVVILAFISLVRYCSMLELVSNSGGSSNASSSVGFGQTSVVSSQSAFELVFNFQALVDTLGTISVMILGAVLELLHSYYVFDPFSSEKKRLAEAHIAEDRSLYARVFAMHAADPDKSLAYEEKERELDRATVESVFRIGDAAAQLNSIVDPADAYDFLTINSAFQNANG